MDQLSASDWAVVAGLAAPHLLYAYIWFFSSQWMAAFKKSSVQVFENTAWLLKVVQAASVAYWYHLRQPALPDLLAVPPACWALALLLGGAGQVLNVSIYRAIGHAGVYYGFKLGHKVPWVTGFPFNVVSHPQYVGSVLSVWGAAALLWTQAPPGLGLIAAYWTCLYVITGFQESLS